MKERLFKAACACLLPALLLSACWQEEPPETQSPVSTEPEEALSEGPLLPERFALPWAPDMTLDPVTCPDGMQQVVASLLCEGLFRLGPDLEPEPWLCQSFSYDPSTYTYTLTLRSGVTFSDGSPLTAADVKATLDRARTSQRYGARLSAVSRITAGDGQITIALSRPNTGFPALLDIPIVKSGSGEIPIGTGPYLFSNENSESWLIANQSWWHRTSLPLDRIALMEAGDQDTMLYRFSSHDVQLITADLTGTAPISAAGNVIYLNADTTILQYIGINVQRAGLEDPALRRCLGTGIDRTHLVSAFLSSHGTATQFPVSPVSPLYPSALEEAYSATGFSAVLSGLEHPQSLTLLVNEENRFKVSAAQKIADDLTAGGITVTLRALPWEEYTAALAAGSFDLYYGEVRLTADWDLSALLATGGALNYGGWADPQTDQLLADYAAASDRAVALERLCAYLKAQAPILPVCFKSSSVLVQAGVMDGLEPTASEPLYNLPDCTVHLRER